MPPAVDSLSATVKILGIFSGYLNRLARLQVDQVQVRRLAALARIAPRGGLGVAVVFLVTGAALVSSPAHADAGTVSGELTLAPATQRGAPPVRAEGFVPRAQNPLKSAEPYDPRPHIVVVLEGGPQAGGARGDRLRYAIDGAAFASPIMPVHAGEAFEIQNRGSHSPRLYAPGAPEILAGEPLNPRGTQSVTVEQPYRAYAIRDRESAHLEATIVAFPHRHFSPVSADGRFEISGVPAGSYEVRVGYRTGWLNTRAERVTVSEGGRPRVQIAIPPRLEVEPPQTDDATE